MVFVEYRQVSAGSHGIFMGIGSREKVLEVGTHHLKMCTGHTLLYDALYVLGIWQNLLSIAILLGLDFLISFNSDAVNI